MGLAQFKFKYFALAFLFCNTLTAKPKAKPKVKAKPTKSSSKVVQQIKKPILGHEKLVELLEEQLPLFLAKGSINDFDKNILAFTSEYINKFSAVPSSVNWEYLIEREQNAYPIKDTTLSGFQEIMLLYNFKQRLRQGSPKMWTRHEIEALYFSYRFYLATLNKNLQALAKGKAHIAVDLARDVFIKARKSAGSVLLQHLQNHETLKKLSETSFYLLGDFLIPGDPTLLLRKESGLFHNESIVKIDHQSNYAFEIYNYSPKKIRTSYKNYQLIGLESATALLYQNGNKKYLVLAKDALSSAKEIPALEWSGEATRYIRFAPRKSLGTRTDITIEDAHIWRSERLKLLTFYRKDFDEKRKSRIEAAEESVKDGSFVDSILRKLNNDKDLNSIIQEKTNGLEQARRRLYTVFNDDGNVNEELTLETKLAYENALKTASLRTGIPQLVIETSIYLESSFDLLSENTKEKRDQKGNYELSGDVWGKGLAQLSPAEALMPLDEFYNSDSAEIINLKSQVIAYGDQLNENEETNRGKAHDAKIATLIERGALSENDFVVPEYVKEVENLLIANKWKQLNEKQLKLLKEKEDIRKSSWRQIQQWIREGVKSPKSVWSPYYAIQRFSDHLFAIQKQDYYLMGSRKAGPYLFGDQYSVRNSDQMRFLLAIYNRGQGYLTNSIDFQRVYNGGVLIPGNYYYTWAAGRGKTEDEKLAMIQAQWDKEQYFTLPKGLHLRERPTKLKVTLETQPINLRHIIYGFGLGDQANESSVYGILKKLSE